MYRSDSKLITTGCVQRPVLALAYRLGAAVVASTVAMLVKHCGESGLPVTEIMFWRQATCLPVILLWLTTTGRLAQIRTKRATTHAARAILGMIAMGLLFTATVRLPLAMSTTLGFATPLFATALAALAYRQDVGARQWVAVLLGFLGIVMIAHPGADQVSSIGVAAMLVGAFVVALVNFQVRDLARTESVAGIVFWLSLCGTLVTAPLMLVDLRGHDMAQWIQFFALGVLGAVGQLLLTASLRYGAVQSVAVMDYSQIIWATLYAWVIWGQLPDPRLYMGAPLIIVAGMAIVHGGIRQPRP